MKTVLDASVLIDLISFDLLEAWFALGYETVTTTLVWREVNRRSQKAKIQEYVKRGGLSIKPVGAELLIEIVQLHVVLESKVSLEDASVLQISASQQAILLSSDKVLRRCAEDRGITVHGLLWVMDLLVSRGKLLPGVAADRLEQMIVKKAIRLPLAECRQRIRKWRNE
jgi:predicted nucleic acid-binding protein